MTNTQAYVSDFYFEIAKDIVNRVVQFVLYQVEDIRSAEEENADIVEDDRRNRNQSSFN